MSKTGVITPAVDSLRDAGCIAGRTWVRLGRTLVQSGMADKVIFLPVIIDKGGINQWVPGGLAYRRLADVAKMASVQHIHFDYALWQQGVSDYGTDPRVYVHALNKLIKFGSVNFSLDKWLIAQTVSAGEDISKAQIKLGWNPVLNRFPGPKISPSYDGVFHNKLTEKACEQLAQLWREAIINADANSNIYQKESLQYYFQ